MQRKKKPDPEGRSGGVLPIDADSLMGDPERGCVFVADDREQRRDHCGAYRFVHGWTFAPFIRSSLATPFCPLFTAQSRGVMPLFDLILMSDLLTNRSSAIS